MFVTLDFHLNYNTQILYNRMHFNFYNKLHFLSNFFYYLKTFLHVHLFIYIV
jgi:hypothetical protein